MFSHDTAKGMFSSTEEALSKNPDNPEAPLYSILSKLESYRNADGSFHFKICYPEKMAAKLGHCNEWIQTSNPVTEGTIKGFKKIHLAFPKNGGGRDWVGIGKTGKSGPSLIDDTGSAASWWMAIGATGNNPAGSKNIPGPWLNNVKKVELYVKDNSGTGAPEEDWGNDFSWLQWLRTISGCPSGWSKFRDHCYKIDRVRRPWKDALEFCEKYQVKAQMFFCIIVSSINF